MEKLQCLLFLAASAFLFFNFGEAINCYSCNSHFDSDCGFNDAPLNESHVRQCEDNATQCRKIRQWVDYKENGMGPDERVVRECGYNQTKDRSYYYRQGLGGRMEVASCYTDFCNAADYPSFNNILIICLTVFNLVILNSFK